MWRLLIAALLIAAMVYLVYRIWKPRGSTHRLAGASLLDLRRQLLRHCLGDRQRADRLVELERRKDPSIDEAEALRRAIESIERDQS